MIKTKQSSSLNPWEALFSSATRPQAVDDVSASGSSEKDGAQTQTDGAPVGYTITPTPETASGGYTILLQHSMTAKSQRQWALSATMAMTTEQQSRMSGGSMPSNKLLQSSMANMSLKSSQNIANARRAFQGSSWYGMAGPFLVRQAFEELCQRCDGAVVFVSLLGTSGVLDFDELEDQVHDDNGYATIRSDEGANSNLQGPKKRSSALKSFRRNGAWVDLSSDPFGWDDNDDETEDNIISDSFVHKAAMNKLQPIAMAIRNAASQIENRRASTLAAEQRGKKKQMQQPIPIVFETLTPLLQLHGVQKVSLLLKSLGRMLSSTRAVSNGRQPILSPIVAPVLYESLCPSEHRSLEDIADAMVHLNLMGAQHQSVSTANERKSTQIKSGVLDLVRRGGGGSGLGGKLIRHCVPIHVMKSVSTESRDGCYWIIDHDDTPDEPEDAKSNQQNTNAGKSEQNGAQSASSVAVAAPSRPRIYLEDDDPEFDDFDEEDDLDDDLDL